MKYHDALPLIILAAFTIKEARSLLLGDGSCKGHAVPPALAVRTVAAKLRTTVQNYSG
jgi:hypothetical protein